MRFCSPIEDHASLLGKCPPNTQVRPVIKLSDHLRTDDGEGELRHRPVWASVHKDTRGTVGQRSVFRIVVHGQGPTTVDQLRAEHGQSWTVHFIFDNENEACAFLLMLSTDHMTLSTLCEMAERCSVEAL